MIVKSLFNRICYWFLRKPLLEFSVDVFYGPNDYDQ